MIVCSESSFVRSDVYLFVQDSPILFQWSIAALFEYAFVETFTAKFKLIRGDFIASVCYVHRHNFSVHLNSSLNRPVSLSYHVVCVLHNMFWGGNLLQHQQ